MSENNDKKQDIEDITNYKKAEVVPSGSRFFEQTVVEETIIEEVTISASKGKTIAQKGGDNKIVDPKAAMQVSEVTKTETAVQPSAAVAEAEIPDTLEQGEAGDEAKKGKKTKRKHSGLSKFLNILLVFIIAVLAVTIVFLNVFVLCPVSQESMYPTINDGQRVLLLRSKKVQRDEIFVYDSGEINPSTGKKINLIKRAVGLGGDRLLYATTDTMPTSTSVVMLFRDTGEGFVLLEESFINEPMFFGDMPLSDYSMVFIMDGDTVDETSAANFVITVPKGQFYALGDNRNNSNDSRSKGFVEKKKVVGRLKVKLKSGSFAEKVLRVLYRDTKSS